MAYLVARAAAAALPSGRARPLGSGRLPLAALSRQGTVVLAGQKVGAGHAGELAFKVSSLGWGLSSLRGLVLLCVFHLCLRGLVLQAPLICCVP